jgi:protein gp37
MRHKARLEGKGMPEQYAKPFGNIQFFPDRLDIPRHWEKPRNIFVCSMGDLFHPQVTNQQIAEIMAAMIFSPQHNFLILTKRPKRLNQFMGDVWHFAPPVATMDHVWFGVTVCNQAEADEKIPLLLDTPAAHRFVSVEPMLGPIDMSTECLTDELGSYPFPNLPQNMRTRRIDALDWVICGGETGKNARPMHPDWVRSLCDQCAGAGVPFHFKQWGEWAEKSQMRGATGTWWPSDEIEGKYFDYPMSGVFNRVGAKRAGHLLDGVEHRAFPAELMAGREARE